MPYNYTDQEVLDRVKDEKRGAGYAETYANFLAGKDPTAITRMAQAAESAATPDGKNAARLYLSRMTGQPMEYVEKGDAGFNLGHTLGGFLKVAAPIAGALIPGVGMLGAGLIGAGGSALGGIASGDRFNLGKTLLAGGAAAAGNKLLGNGFGGGSSNWGFGSSQGGIPTGAPGTNTQGSGGVGSSGIPSGSPGGGGFLDRFGGLGGILQKYGPLALGGLGALQHASEANKASGLRDQGVRMATDDWNSRAGLRSKAIELASAAPAAPRQIQFSDPTDPYRRGP